MDLSVIIVSYNTKDLLKKCIDSVAEEWREVSQTSISGEIIVVDNGSNDGSIELLKELKNHKSYFINHILFNRENLGFGGANNLGAERAQGRYLLFLNSDAEVKAGALGKMVEFLDQNPKVGIASCQLVNTDGTIQFQGGYLPRLRTVAAWALFMDDLPILREILPSYQMRSTFQADPRRHFFGTLGQGGDSGTFFSGDARLRDSIPGAGRLKPRSLKVRPIPGFGSSLSLDVTGSLFPGKKAPSSPLVRDVWFTGWVGGTAMFVRREAWKQLGGFDEKIFMYGEDVELCYRANKQGWKVAVNPEAEIVHAGKASGGKWVTGEVEGLLYIFKKHKPGWEMPILRGILAAGMGLRWVIFGILGGNEILRRAYAEAFRVVRR